jgi:MYXO-CTERM domain-containing protein
MALVHPEEPAAWAADLQYYWGDHLIVAPSANAADATVDVWLPPGAWFDFWTGQSFAGDTTVAYRASRGRLPLFVRAGAVIPMAPFAESTAFLRRDVLDVHVWPGADGWFELVEDDGVSERFASGERRVTAIAWNDADRTLTIGAATGTYRGAPAARRITVVVHGDAGRCASVGGVMLPFVSSDALGTSGVSYSGGARAGTLRLDAGTFAADSEIAIALSDCASGPATARIEAEAGRTNATPGSKPGASGGSYVGGLDAVETYVEITAEVPSAGAYDLVAGYANGRAELAERVLIAGGVEHAVVFAPRYDWETFGTTDVVRVNLARGTNVLRFETRAGALGVADLDFVDLTASQVPAPFVRRDGVIAIDAEHFSARHGAGGHAFRVITYPHDYAGDGSVISGPDVGAQIDAPSTASAPRLEYEVDFDEAGTYYVWIRGHAFGDGDRDSAHVAIDGMVPATAEAITFTNSAEWRWTGDTMDGGRASIEVTSAGRHTVGLVMREDGTIVDRVLLTADASYTPSGRGPDETRASAPAPTADGGVNADGGASRDGGAAAMEPSDEGCGCSAARTSALGPIALLALAAFSRRRRAGGQSSQSKSCRMIASGSTRSPHEKCQM